MLIGKELEFVDVVVRGPGIEVQFEMLRALTVLHWLHASRFLGARGDPTKLLSWNQSRALSRNLGSVCQLASMSSFHS